MVKTTSSNGNGDARIRQASRVRSIHRLGSVMKRFPLLVSIAAVPALSWLGVWTCAWAEPPVASPMRAKPAAIAPAKSIDSGLLLEPPLELNWFTREKFARAASTVGAEKIRKKWTTPIAPLPSHKQSEQDSANGLTIDEVKSYMVRVREIFDRGEAIPVSDVGLISTQEDVIRQPMLNHICAFENDSARVYLLVQKTYEGKAWGYFSIVQDKTVDPPIDYFGEVLEANVTDVKIEATSCYKCHSSGPLAIHPAREDLVLDAKLAFAINEYIAEQPRSVFHFPEDSPRPKTGNPMKLGACTACHQEDGDRGPLFQVHSHPIRIMVDFGYMPPDGPLSVADTAELKAWLNESDSP